RGGRVEPSARIDDDAIIAPRLLRGDEAVQHVVQHALRIARERIAHAAAARQLEADRVTRRHGLPSLGPDGPSRAQRHRARCAGTAAGAATRGGNEVALRPSLVGRAPAPPQWKITVLNSGSALASVPSSTSSTSEPPPKICGFHNEDAPSAGTPPGITCCRQPNTTSGSICP